MTIAVELARTVDGPDLLAALSAQGIDGRLGNGGLELSLRAEDAGEVTRALESWAAERSLPFLPVRLGKETYALVPPAG